MRARTQASSRVGPGRGARAAGRAEETSDAAPAGPSAGVPTDAPALPSESPAALRRILLNAASLLGAYVFPRVLTFASVVVAARVLGPGGFGAYGTAAAFAVVLSIVATLGMMPLLVRDLAREPDRVAELLGAAHLVKAVSGGLMLLALVGVSYFVLAYPAEVTAAAFLLGVGYAVGAFAENLGAWFQAIERMGVWMQANALFGFVTGTSGALFVWWTGSVVWFCAAPLLGQLAALAWLRHRAPRGLRRGRAGSIREARRFARALVPFAAAFVALTLFYKIDVLLLTAWRGAEEVGVYVAAYKFVDVAHALVLAAVAAVYPRLCRQAPGVGRGERWAAARVTELFLLAAVPAAGLAWLLRGELVGTLFGPGYGASAGALAWLAPALPALALNLLAGYVLAARGKMRLAALGYAAGMVLKVGLLAVLAPDGGAEGAAVAMLVSELSLALGFLALLVGSAGTMPSLRALAAAGGAGGLAVGAGILVSLLSPDAAIAGALLFLAAVTALYRYGGAIPAHEWTLLRRALALDHGGRHLAEPGGRGAPEEGSAAGGGRS